MATRKVVDAPIVCWLAGFGGWKQDEPDLLATQSVVIVDHRTDRGDWPRVRRYWIEIHA